VAFCPHPPLVVPDLAGSAAPELADLRAACRTAIRRIARPGTQIVVLGSGPAREHFGPTARGTFRSFGVPLEVSLGVDLPAALEPAPDELPLSLAVGAWLLRDAIGANCGASGWSVPLENDAAPLPLDDDVRRSLLVMADGSARRSTSAPGYLDERATDLDAHLADALRGGQPERLRIDAEQARALLVGGAAAWNEAARLLAGRNWDAELLYDTAPYGVGYFAAVWVADA
jgi:hypothetical protein